MQNLQSALNTLKGQEIYFALIDNKTISGNVKEVGADFVCLNTAGTVHYIPFHAIVHFQQSGTETFSAEYIGAGIPK